MTDRSAEQQARDLLARMEVDGAQNFSAGELVELANIIRGHNHDTRVLELALDNAYKLLNRIAARDGAVLDAKTNEEIRRMLPARFSRSFTHGGRIPPWNAKKTSG